MIQVDIPNAKQAFVNSDGKINKVWRDFLWRLWLRTGGDSDTIDDSDIDLAITNAISLQRRVQDLEKLVKDLQKEINQLGC